MFNYLNFAGNRKLTVFLLMLVILPVSLVAQNVTPNVGGSKRCNVVFPSDYVLPFKEAGVKSRFTPLTEDLKTAQAILAAFPNMVPRKCILQYIGYIDVNNDKILLINVLTHLGKKKNKLYYSDWNKEFIIGFGRIFEKNTMIRKVNLTTRELVEEH